jgi:NAD(P)-dependent dehydrogenase (short-subunit alcohol dehydrogenase family)
MREEFVVNLSFENKVALVTGAASGMGLATAKAFAEAGAAVALADVNEVAVRSAADDLVAAGRKAIGIRCDVADEAEVAAMVEQTVSTFGRLDAAFNNAGVQAPPSDMADEERDQPARCVSVHEARTPPHARAGDRRDRQLLFAGWSRGAA